MSLLEINKISEIITLRKAIFMLKYNHDKRDIANFTGSNILYTLLQDFEKIIKDYSVTKDVFLLQDIEHINVVKEYIKYYDSWLNISDEQKIKIVQMVAYPLIVDEKLSTELIKYGDENNETNNNS